MAASACADCGTHRTILTATRSLNSRSSVHHPTTDADMQREYECQQYDGSLHSDHANRVVASSQQ
jgi:hypothetical protein